MNNELFRLIRAHTGMSQRKFGEFIGISESTVSMIECGQRTVTANTTVKIARHFELNDDFLRLLENYRKLSQQ